MPHTKFPSRYVRVIVLVGLVVLTLVLFRGIGQRSGGDETSEPSVEPPIVSVNPHLYLRASGFRWEPNAEKVYTLENLPELVAEIQRQFPNQRITCIKMRSARAEDYQELFRMLQTQGIPYSETYDPDLEDPDF